MRFEDLKGKTLVEINRVKGEYAEDERINFKDSEGNEYVMYHVQDCCEYVTVEDINGEVSDILNSEILLAEERSNSNETNDGSETYTFYTLRTVKGSLDIRWHGESNGYYSEDVNFSKI